MSGWRLEKEVSEDLAIQNNTIKYNKRTVQIATAQAQSIK